MVILNGAVNILLQTEGTVRRNTRKFSKGGHAATC